MITEELKEFGFPSLEYKEVIKEYSFEEANKILSKIAFILGEYENRINSLGMDVFDLWNYARNYIGEKNNINIGFYSWGNWYNIFYSIYRILRPDFSKDEAYKIAFEYANRITSYIHLSRLFDYIRISNPFEPLERLIEMGVIPGEKVWNRFSVEIPTRIDDHSVLLIYLNGNTKLMLYKKWGSNEIKRL